MPRAGSPAKARRMAGFLCEGYARPENARRQRAAPHWSGCEIGANIGRILHRQPASARYTKRGRRRPARLPRQRFAKERGRCHNSDPVCRTCRHPLPERAPSDCKDAQIDRLTPWCMTLAVCGPGTVHGPPGKPLRDPRPAKSTCTARLRASPAGLALLLTACGAIQPKLASDPNSLAPPTATKLWAPEEATRIPGGKATLDAFSARSAPAPAAIQPRARLRPAEAD
jgi:hypothetical protein